MHVGDENEEDKSGQEEQDNVLSVATTLSNVLETAYVFQCFLLFSLFWWLASARKRGCPGLSCAEGYVMC